ncbi:3837_t:CDS:2 [Ambispora gerdemannii]|uniref:3837_t:CDS:1 n=1 Tax=Ambispora gerdemannii TaxID=144530 RepID=A0A9N8WET0_9GLOM|nr:3837_t:CDS:2 [Ambispora gerdemannii]
MSVIMGTSGCDKLAFVWNFYAESMAYTLLLNHSVLALRTWKNAAIWTRTGIAEKTAEELAEQAIWSCITARLVLLHYLLNEAKQYNTVMAPKKILKDHGFNMMEDIKAQIRNEYLPIIYDEAQIHTTFLANTFLFHNIKIMPFFSMVVSLRMQFANVIVHVSGSGLSLLRARANSIIEGKG